MAANGSQRQCRLTVPPRAIKVNGVSLGKKPVPLALDFNAIRAPPCIQVILHTKYKGWCDNDFSVDA